MSFTGCKLILTLSEMNCVEENPESLTSSRGYLSCLDLTAIIVFTRGKQLEYIRNQSPILKFIFNIILSFS